MTVEELLGKSADELESFTDAEFEEWLKPYLPYTRPELQQVTAKTTNNKRIASHSERLSKKQLAEQILFEQLGRRIKL